MRQKKNAGFSTLEMIVTTLILGLSLTVVANGASAVQRIYRRTLAKADAQMIYSQVETNLRAELAFADAVNDVDNVTKYYINNGERSIEYTLELKDPDATLKAGSALFVSFTYKENPYQNFLSPTKQERLENLKVTMPTIKYNSEGYFEVSNLNVLYEGKSMLDGFVEDETQFIIQAANKIIASP